jgi:ABC-type xylose transport system permease subunit
MNVIQRAQATTPGFFKTVRTIGLLLVAISGAIITVPVVLPAAVVTVAGYLAVGGSVAAAVSQLTINPAEPTSSAEPALSAGSPASPAEPVGTPVITGGNSEAVSE